MYNTTTYPRVAFGAKITHDIKIRESIESNTYDFDAPKVYSSNSEKISITNHVDNQKSSDEHAGAKTPNSPIDK